MQITFLGTGTSVGVPRIGCDCPVCRSAKPRNQRLRCSILIEQHGCSILVDTSPDLRAQALRHNIRSLDAILFTHSHADHLHGLDDVRAFCFDRQEPLPVYGDHATLDRIRHVFDYAFNSVWAEAVPRLSLNYIEAENLNLMDLTIRPIRILHGRLPILAFRIGDFAYVTDCSHIPDQSMQQLQDLDTLVLGALRHREHPTHFSVAQAIDIVKQLQPRQTYFTHIAHDLEHEETNKDLPEHIELAYDGLKIDLT